MKYSDKIINGLCLGDTCRGTVISRIQKGVFIELENGLTAYAKGIQLLQGTPVFCSITRHATDEAFTQVSIDSYPFEAVAA